MSLDLQLFGDKLVKYGNNLKLDQDEVCQRIGLEKARFKELENGEVTFSGDEVLMFADFSNRITSFHY